MYKFRHIVRHRLSYTALDLKNQLDCSLLINCSDWNSGESEQLTALSPSLPVQLYMGDIKDKT